MDHEDHVRTRSYGGRGNISRREDEGLSFRSKLTKDIWDIRGINNLKYRRGLLDLINWCRENHPELLEKDK
jgi:hypothetical protein